MTKNKLSIDGLKCEATKIEVANNILNITLNRTEKKNAINNVLVNQVN